SWHLILLNTRPPTTYSVPWIWLLGCAVVSLVATFPTPAMSNPAAGFSQSPSNALPNKRLKLPGGDRLEGSGVLCPGEARTVVPHPCAGARVARSLSAVR